MGIKIDIHPSLHQFTNGQTVAEVNGSTVGQCLDDLGKQCPGIETGLFGKMASCSTMLLSMLIRKAPTRRNWLSRLRVETSFI